eukprot:534795_1
MNQTSSNMSQESQYYEPDWATYVHIMDYVLLIAISIPYFHLSYYVFYNYTRNCLCKSYLLTIFNMSQELRSTTAPQTPDLELSNVASNSVSNSGSISNSSISAQISQQNTKTIAYAADNVDCSRKAILFIAITFSYIYVIFHTVLTTFRLHISDGWKLNYYICRCMGGSVLTYSFITARLFLYLFFILRAYDAFEGTHLGYKKSTIVSVIICGVIGSQSVGMPLLVNTILFKKIVIIQNDIGGDVCKFVPDPNTPSKLISTISFTWGLGLSAFGAVFAFYLLLNRLFKFIRNDKSNASKDKHNEFILLSTKLIILLSIIVCSTMFTYMIQILIPVDLSAVFGPLDNVVQMYCLWLTFNFTQKHYYRYFCGKTCIILCFPFIKSLTLTQHSFCCCCCTYYCGCNEKK